MTASDVPPVRGDGRQTAMAIALILAAFLVAAIAIEALR